MRVQRPSMWCAACIGEASGSHDVPDPIRVSGMPRGPAGISMGCCMCICARSGDATPATSASAAATEPPRVGQPDKAVQEYRYLADVWRTADPELRPEVEEANAALKRLAGRPRR